MKRIICWKGLFSIHCILSGVIGCIHDSMGCGWELHHSAVRLFIVLYMIQSLWVPEYGLNTTWKVI
jgi:hypothetical protein